MNNLSAGEIALIIRALRTHAQVCDEKAHKLPHVVPDDADETFCALAYESLDSSDLALELEAGTKP